MKEIEVKAKVKNRELLLSKLAELGCVLSEPVVQKDRVFLPIGSPSPVPKGTNVLRIREQNGKYIFTLKQPQTNQLDCIEIESVIEDPKAFADICVTLGFVEFSYVQKFRRKTKYNDTEICLDEVEDLGLFIEVEKLSEGDSAAIQTELFDFLQTLGVAKEDQKFVGYDVLLYQQQQQQNAHSA